MTDLRDTLWSLADSTRDTGEAITAFCALLVLRHADELEAEDEAIGVFDRTPFHPSVPSGARWRDLCLADETQRESLLDALRASLARSEDRGGGALVRRTLHALEGVETALLARVFPSVRDLSLASIFDRHAALDALDTVLERALDRSSGAWATPPPLARWMVAVLEIPESARVYDPCFGYGFLLAEVVRQRVHARMESTERKPVTPGVIAGVERDPRAFAVGLARVILAGEDRPALELGDVFDRDTPSSLLRDGFDRILLDPPYGVRRESASGAAIPTKSAEALFLQHAMGALRPGGRALLLAPRGLLFRGGSEALVRRAMLTRLRVEAIFHLPRGAYRPLSAVSLAALLLSNTTPAKSIPVIESQLDGAEDLGALARSPSGSGGATARIDVAEALGSEEVSLDRVERSEADDLGSLGEQAPLHRLGELVSLMVWDGRKASAPSGYAAPPLVRASDIRDGVVSPRREVFALRPPSPAHLLRRNDVVVGVRGSRIVAAVVSNGAIGAVPERGVIVLRTEEGRGPTLAPAFLARVLELPQVAAQLLRGSAAPRLSASSLGALRVPVPTLPLQDRALRDVTSANLLDALRVALAEPVDASVTWVEGSPAVSALLADLTMLDETSLVALLVALALDVDAVHGAVAPTPSAVETLAVLSDFRRVTGGMRDLEALPTGAARLAALLAARIDAHAAWWWRPEGREAPRVAALKEAIQRCLTLASRACASRHRVERLTERLTKRQPGLSEFALTFTNVGSIALRSLVMRSAGVTHAAPTLDPGATTTFTVSVPHAMDAREVPLRVEYEARQLDGERVAGHLDLTLDLGASSELDTLRPLDASPYIVGPAITRSEMIFGRDPIFEDLRRLFASPHHAPLVLLEGNKRVGKTSIMQRLLVADAPTNYVVAYLSLQEVEGKSSEVGLTDREVWCAIATRIGRALRQAGVSLWIPDEPAPQNVSRFALDRALLRYFETDHPYAAFEAWLDAALTAIAPRRLLVMIDEFDKLQEGVERGVTSPQLVENLRASYLVRPSLGYLIAGGRRLARLRTEYFSALFGVGHRITVGPLPVEAARRLVTEPVAGQLVWLSDARDEVVTRCAGHPFLIQAVCDQVFLRAAREDERRISLAFVDAAIDEVLDGLDHFQTLWNHVGTARRRLIVALCAVDPRPGEARDLGVLEEELGRRGVALPPEGIAADLAHLDDLEVIALETSGTEQRYRLRLPLLAAWVRRRVDLTALARDAAQQLTREES